MGLQLLLPVLFFLITLIIIYLVRLEDRRDRRLDVIKKRMSDFSMEVERVIQNFRDTAQLTEERINKRSEASKTLSVALDGQLADLQSRSEDLSKLQDVLNTYRDSISRLGATTATVESRIGQVKREVERLEAVNAKIQQFDARLAKRMEELDHSMDEQQGRYERFAAQLTSRYDGYDRSIRELQGTSEAILLATQGAFDELGERLKGQERAQQQAITEATQQFEALLDQHRHHLDQLCKHIDEACSDRLQSFSGACDRELETMVERSVGRTDETFKAMVGVIIGFIQDLEDRANQSEELNALLIRQQQANLAEYSEEIQLLQKLSSQSEESIRRDELRRRELSEVRAHLKDETIALRKDLDQMIEEKRVLLTANAQAKAEQESLQSALAHLSLQLIKRQDELISGDGDEELGEALFEDEDIEEEADLPIDEGGQEDDFDEELGEALFEDEEIEEETDLPIDEGGQEDDSDEEPGEALFEDEDIEEEADLPIDEGGQEDDSDEELGEALFEDEEEGLPGDGQEGPPQGEIDERSVLAVEEELALLEDVALPPQEAESEEGKEWIEYIPEGEEEEISLDEEDDLGS